MAEKEKYVRSKPHVNVGSIPFTRSKIYARVAQW